MRCARLERGCAVRVEHAVRDSRVQVERVVVRSVVCCANKVECGVLCGRGRVPRVWGATSGACVGSNLRVCGVWLLASVAAGFPSPVVVPGESVR